MKALGIMGSPRIHGNTHLLLDAALEGVRSRGAETETMLVDKLNIAPCREYYTCLKTGDCYIRDDMDRIYPLLWTSEIVIIAAPVFFYGLPAQLKALIDRGQALWARTHALGQSPAAGRRGAFIAVGATRGKRLFEGSLLTVKYFFKAVGVKYSGEVLIRGVDRFGEIRKQPVFLDEAYNLGRNLAQI